MRLHLDYETFSEVDIRKVTTSYYTSHPSTEVLMLGWAIEDNPPQLWEPGEPFPVELNAALYDPLVRVHAYNAPFERGLTEHKLGVDVPTSRWRDTMVEAFALSFPAGLDRVLEAIGLQKKDARGKRLIDLFCSPAPKNHKADRYDKFNRPEEWEEFRQYCLQDVSVERKLHLWLEQYHGMSEEEWGLWFLDQEINRRGLPVDPEMAEGALCIWRRERAEIVEELRQITGLEKITRQPFLDWLAENGCPLPDTRKDTISAALDQGYPAPVLRALRLWSYKEVRAIDKYKTILGTHQAKRLHGIFQYGGASRTRRWAGRTFQPHNLKRTMVPVAQIDCLAEALRRADLSALRMFW